MQNNDIQRVDFNKMKVQEETRTRQHQGEPDRIMVYQNVKRGRKHVILMN